MVTVFWTARESVTVAVNVTVPAAESVGDVHGLADPLPPAPYTDSIEIVLPYTPLDVTVHVHFERPFIYKPLKPETGVSAKDTVGLTVVGRVTVNVVSAYPMTRLPDFVVTRHLHDPDVALG